MKKNIKPLLGIAATGMMLASSAHATKKTPVTDKTTEKATDDASNCTGKDGCMGKTKCPNSCKGKSECKSAKNASCKGHNDCKGMGWVALKEGGSCPKVN
jgi:hypothetical protein